MKYKKKFSAYGAMEIIFICASYENIERVINPSMPAAFTFALALAHATRRQR